MQIIEEVGVFPEFTREILMYALISFNIDVGI
jgi:hypothetical protein